jgi:hypothetical protein
MKVEMPSYPAPGSVTALTITEPASEAFVMNCFVPLRTHSSPSRSALVSMSEASEPESGSVSAHDPIVSPSASGRSQRSRCSSVP